MTRPTLVAEFTVRRPDFDVSVALTAEPGRPLALVGPNGAGKSTVVDAISGILPIADGRILVGSRVLDDTAVDVSLPIEHRRIGVVFQRFALFPHLSVRDNVGFAARASGGGRRRARALAEPWLARYGLTALADRHPHELSGGQAQRVAIARALAAEPAVLLLDEPMASLDVEIRDELRAELATHLREFSGATIIVTHSVEDVEVLADDVAVLERGRITQRGGLAALRAAPATPYVARLVSGDA